MWPRLPGELSTGGERSAEICGELGCEIRRSWLKLEREVVFGLVCGISFVRSVLIYFSPTAESFGVLAKLSPGALWGSHLARFWQVPRFQVRVPSKGSGRFRGSK